MSARNLISQNNNRETFTLFLRNAQELSEGTGINPDLIEAVREVDPSVRIRRNGAVEIGGQVVGRINKEMG